MRLSGFGFAGLFLTVSCQQPRQSLVQAPVAVPIQNGSVARVVAAAVGQTGITTGYSQTYYKLSYPGGDPPIKTGACTDVVIRALRKEGVDLQKLVHEDMAKNFTSYPRKWGLRAPDTNIDHRRVPNLQVFLSRAGKQLPISQKSEDYLPGDIVTWLINGNLTHIGMVTNIRVPGSPNLAIVHNIGAGVNIEDRLFDWQITGHYRWFKN